jgi:hypothetical protein
MLMLDLQICAKGLVGVWGDVDEGCLSAQE